MLNKRHFLTLCAAALLQFSPTNTAWSQPAFDQAFTAKDYPKTIELGRAILAANPNDQHVLATLQYAVHSIGSTKSDYTLYPAGAEYALKAYEVTKAAPQETSGYFNGNKAEALASHQFYRGLFITSTRPAEAATLFREVALSNTANSRQSLTYRLLGDAILQGHSAPLARRYKAEFDGKPSTPQAEQVLGQMRQANLKVMDAYARSLALSTEPRLEAIKAQTAATLKTLYKAQFHSEEGLDKFIAEALSKPLP